MSAAVPWRPILDGALATRCTTILDDVITALRNTDTAVADPTLDHGAGRALLWSYLDKARPDEGFSELRDAAIDGIIEQVAAMDLSATLYGGFSGAAWVIDHVLGDDDDDPVEAIDAALLELLHTDPWPFDFDLLYGLAGLGVYALGRLQRPLARECLARVVAQLDALAELRNGGVAWRSRPELLPRSKHEQWPRGYYNYGVAHGVPAVALVLSGAVRAGIATARAKPLLDGAVRWQWAGARSDRSESTFDNWEQDGIGFGPARLAWCYGDAGVATTLHAAALAIGDAAAASRALAVARRSTARKLEDTGVVDAGLCHGSAGLALLYARLAHESSDPLLAEAARRWYAHLAEQHVAGVGVGGFRSFAGDDKWNDGDASFLTGATGIALSLVAALYPVEPAWDCLLAASLPARV
jgi:hypothetical protein